MTLLQKNLANIKTLITQYEQKYNRTPGSVHLLAASKGQSVDKIDEVFQAGQSSFGESYLQEALTKIVLLPYEKGAKEQIEWHFIGPIQSNKTRKIAEHFSWVHSVCDIKAAKRLNDQRPKYLPPLNICIQVNISQEATKSGAAPDEVQALAEYCLTLPQLKLRGLMAIPAPNKNFSDQRHEFHKLSLLKQLLKDRGIPLDTLSMGMSEDFEAAIAEGSTFVRIGTRLFGERG